MQRPGGSPFTSGSWSTYIKGIFYQFTGQNVGINTIRSSFVTNLEEMDLSEKLKTSLARSMKHNRKTVS